MIPMDEEIYIINFYVLSIISRVFQYSSLFKILNLYKINHFIRIKN